MNHTLIRNEPARFQRSPNNSLCVAVQILLAPAGGKKYPATDPYVDYYGPEGGPIDFDA